MMGWNFLEMRFLHPSSPVSIIALSISQFPLPFSSFYSTHFRVVIFHYFIMCTLIPLSCSLSLSMATRRFIILHMSLKFRPRFFTKWLPFSILCNFSTQCSCLSAKKRDKNEMKEAFLLISWQISIANFTAVVSSVGFDHQYTVFTAFSLLPFPSSLQLHSWCVFAPTAMSYDSWVVLRRIKNY